MQRDISVRYVLTLKEAMSLCRSMTKEKVKPQIKWESYGHGSIDFDFYMPITQNNQANQIIKILMKVNEVKLYFDKDTKRLMMCFGVVVYE